MPAPDNPLSPEQFEQLLPLAAAWAGEQEKCLTIGYPAAPLEQEAIVLSEKLLPK